jgi:hypothetical protein
VYKSRIFLGAVASASIFAMGVAGPAMASTSRVANAEPRSFVTSTAVPASALEGASPVFDDLSALPFLGGVSDLNGLTNLSDASSGQIAGTTLGTVTGALQRAKTTAGTDSSVADLGNTNVAGLGSGGALSSAANAVPGLGSMGGYLGGTDDAVSDLTDLPGLNSVPGLGGLNGLTNGLTNLGH